MNKVEVNGIYTVDRILKNNGKDMQIIIKNKEGKNAFLEDISIFVQSPSYIREGDKFKIDAITSHTKQTARNAKGYYVYSGICCDIHKVTEDEEEIVEEKKELKELW